MVLTLLPRPRSDVFSCVLPVPKTVEGESFDEEELLVRSPGLGEDGV